MQPVGFISTLSKEARLGRLSPLRNEYSDITIDFRGSIKLISFFIVSIFASGHSEGPISLVVRPVRVTRLIKYVVQDKSDLVLVLGAFFFWTWPCSFMGETTRGKRGLIPPLLCSALSADVD